MPKKNGNKKRKVVYVGMCADVIHNGHINIIASARELGDLVVGLLTDEAVATYKRVPLLPFDKRKLIIENVVGVTKVIPQETLDYVPNLRLIKPDYVVHGDDWKTGIQRETRQRVIDTLNEWGGELIEPDYNATGGTPSTQLINHLLEGGVTSTYRCGLLRRYLAVKPLIRVLEAHNGLTGLIAEKTKIIKDGKVREFDAIWESSLTDSASRANPIFPRSILPPASNH